MTKSPSNYPITQFIELWLQYQFTKTEITWILQQFNVSVCKKFLLGSLHSLSCTLHLSLRSQVTLFVLHLKNVDILTDAWHGRPIEAACFVVFRVGM